MSSRGSQPPATARRGLLARLRGDIRGNTLAIMAASLVPLTAMAGSAVDMSRLYVVKVRLQQACDAGALAGRKFMSGTTYSTDANTQAEKFFDNNFKTGIFGSATVTKSFTKNADSQVSGTASAVVPMTLMKTFGMPDQTITVTCEAKLEIPNLDIMFVLDTTGSMADTNPGDTTSRIAALRTSVGNFYDAIAAAQKPGTQVRYGFVPYATNVNVGMLLKSSWMADTWKYQSRVFNHADPTSSTSTTNKIVIPPGWTYSGGKTTSSYTYAGEDCIAPANENYTRPYTNVLTRTDGTTNYYTETYIYNGTTYSASWQAVGSVCKVTKTVYNNYVQTEDYYTTPCTGTACTSNSYNYYWDYKQVDYPQIATFKGASDDATMVGGWFNALIGNGSGGGPTPTKVEWGGTKPACIEERKTVKQTDYTTYPTSAYDMDFDMIPNKAFPDTQWKPALAGVIYARKSPSNWYQPDVLNVASNYQYMPSLSSGFFTTCPSAAKKLATMTKAQVKTYMDGLAVGGNTYHDIGFLWGVRLISPTGLFASENNTAPNGSSISRHVIFMTDGDTDTDISNYEAYGLPALDQRRTVGMPNNLDQNTLVANRLSAMCTAAKQKGLTVWVIAFGTTLTTTLSNCANSGKAYQANNTTELNNAFTNIASSIAKLRISK